MNLTNEQKEVVSGNDSIVIIDNFQSIRGGRTLNVEGFTPEVIPAGHVIIQEDATGEYKPAPISGDAYDTLPEDHTIKGILIATIPTNRPFAGILVRGTVNIKVAPYKLEANTALVTAIETALGKGVIQFTSDKA